MSKKTKKEEKKKLLKPTHPIAQRRVFIKRYDWDQDTPNSQYLHQVNEAILSAETTLPIFINATNRDETLILTTAPHVSAAQYTPFIGYINEALAGQVTTGTSQTHIVLHNLSTAHSLEYSLGAIQLTYPKLQATALRWLTTMERRDGKKNSSAVLTMSGIKTFGDLGAKHILLHGDRLTLATYHPSRPSTMCARCLEKGHSTPLCKAPYPICSVCASNHLSAKHPCTVPRCKKGACCTHPPLCCKMCGPGHRFGDNPECTEKVAPFYRSPLIQPEDEPTSENERDILLSHQCLSSPVESNADTDMHV